MTTAVVLIVLTGILVSKGISGCLTFILATTFIMVASVMLFSGTGVFIGILFSLGLAAHQIRR